MIISISGVPGSGKTSVGKLVAECLGYRFYSIGGLRGKMALERGLTIAELNCVGEMDPSTDTSVDEYQRALGKKEDHFVIEGRLSWYFIPQSFKVLLTCGPSEAARRVYDARRASSEGREDEPVYESVEAALRSIEERITSDKLRYSKYYGLDYSDAAHYDLVIDTTDAAGAHAVAEQIIVALKNHVP